MAVVLCAVVVLCVVGGASDERGGAESLGDSVAESERPTRGGAGGVRDGDVAVPARVLACERGGAAPRSRAWERCGETEVEAARRSSGRNAVEDESRRVRSVCARKSGR